MGVLQSQLVTRAQSFSQLINPQIIIACILLSVMSVAQVSAQQFNLNKTVSTTNPTAGLTFNYQINASCNSSTQDCESATIVDPLHPSLEFVAISQPLPDGVSSAVYDPVTHTVTVQFDATSCTSCTPDGINTDNDDFAQGSSIQLTIQVRFEFSTFTGTTVENTAYGYSDNAGNPVSSAPIVTSLNGTPPLTSCDQLFLDHDLPFNISQGGEVFMSIRVGNVGFSDLEDVMTITMIPDELDFHNLQTPYVPFLDHAGSLFYERSDIPGTWVHWVDFNVDTEQREFLIDENLPVGVRVTAIRMDLDDMPGDGTWNPHSFNDLWNASLRLYSFENGTLAQGVILEGCSTYSGYVNGVLCEVSECDDVAIQVPSPILTGGISNEDLGGVSQFLYEIGEEYLSTKSFASASANSDTVFGGVLVNILPPGVTYVSHAPSWHYDNIQNLEPVVELEFLPCLLYTSPSPRDRG